MSDVTRTVDALWRIEGARIVATLARETGDFGLAEDLAQEAVADALTQWEESGVPHNAGAWLTTVARRKTIDHWRRRERLDDRYRQIAHTLGGAPESDWQPIDDDVLRLVFTACHPVLGKEAQVALTLRVVGGLSTGEIARMFLVPTATIAQRIVRAKKTLAAAAVPFEAPEPSEWAVRLGAVLGVIYLIFTEGYSSTSGERLVRPELAEEALRLGRILSGLTPKEPEVHGLIALMEFQASRFATRTRADGRPILLEDQDRSRWDHAQIGRGVRALRRADGLGRGRASYTLQAAIAQCHALAPSVNETDWDQIVVLYEALGRIAPNPVVTLNHAIAVSMSTGPANALTMVDDLVRSGALAGSAMLPSVRGELLLRLGRYEEARSELVIAARLSTNDRQRDVIMQKLASIPDR